MDMNSNNNEIDQVLNCLIPEGFTINDYDPHFQAALKEMIIKELNHQKNIMKSENFIEDAANAISSDFTHVFDNISKVMKLFSVR